MQFWNNSRICCLSRQSLGGGCGGAAAAFRFAAAARAARACSRSSLSSLEPKKKGLLMGEWRREGMTDLCFWAVVGLGVRVSAILSVWKAEKLLLFFCWPEVWSDLGFAKLELVILWRVYWGWVRIRRGFLWGWGNGEALRVKFCVSRLFVLNGKGKGFCSMWVCVTPPGEFFFFSFRLLVLQLHTSSVPILLYPFLS